jgi:hypothetical protein
VARQAAPHLARLSIIVSFFCRPRFPSLLRCSPARPTRIVLAASLRDARRRWRLAPSGRRAEAAAGPPGEGSGAGGREREPGDAGGGDTGKGTWGESRGREQGMASWQGKEQGPGGGSRGPGTGGGQRGEAWARGGEPGDGSWGGSRGREEGAGGESMLKESGEQGEPREGAGARESERDHHSTRAVSFGPGTRGTWGESRGREQGEGAGGAVEGVGGGSRGESRGREPWGEPG